MIISLDSPRLRLRDIGPDDWPAVFAYASRPEVYRYQPWGPSTPDDARAFVQHAIAQAQVAPRAVYLFAIERRTPGGVIGTCELTIQNRSFGSAEIGYFLHPDAWGCGYATEAVRRLLAFGFGDLALHRITAQCDPRNTASLRVLERSGMRYEGHLRETMLIRDGWRDSLLYSLLVHEWHGA